jgi:hypothetical protein
VSTYQAASGAGAEGMQELHDGVVQYAKDGTIPAPQVFKHSLPFNVIPHIDDFQENGCVRRDLNHRPLCPLERGCLLSEYYCLWFVGCYFSVCTSTFVHFHFS